MALIRFSHGHINGKCHSILHPKNLLKRYCSLEKNSNITHPIIYFINVQVQRADQQKHLGATLDEKQAQVLPS